MCQNSFLPARLARATLTTIAAVAIVPTLACTPEPEGHAPDGVASEPGAPHASTALFQVAPLRPIDELRVEALEATPPVEEGDFVPSELVELIEIDPRLQLDIRYASTNNFLGSVFYEQARAFLQRPAAEALREAHDALRAQGYGLLIFDGYRPWHVTKMFWDATPDSLRIFVADPAAGSRHNRGAAVDLTLIDLATGVPVEMPSGYDEFTVRAYPDYPGGTDEERRNRDLLRSVMEAYGFSVYEAEWWHFDYHTWPTYAIGNARFEELVHQDARTP